MIIFDIAASLCIYLQHMMFFIFLPQHTTVLKALNGETVIPGEVQLVVQTPAAISC